MQRDWDRKAAFLVITVGCGDADTSLGMSGEGVLPVGEQQFLIASAVKLRIFRVDAGQLCDQVRKITVLCFALFQGDSGTQGCIAFAGPHAFQPPLASIIDGRNARKGEEQCPCQRQMCFFV